MRVIQSTFTKTNQKNFQTGGRAPGAPVLDPPLTLVSCSYEEKQLEKLWNKRS